MIMTAIEDATALVPWAEKNLAALNWAPLEGTLLRALSGPIPAEYATADIPLLRFANGAPAVPLLDAVLEPQIPGPAHPAMPHDCDVSGAPTWDPQTLWVPCGRSVVRITVSPSVRAWLEEDTTADLVWS